MQEHSLELPIAGPIGMLGNSGSFDEANLMPSAQHPQKFYSRRQIFKFLNIFLTWLNVVDKNKLHILNHNPLHTFLSKQQKKVWPEFVSAIVSVVVSQSILYFETQVSFPIGSAFKRHCHLCGPGWNWTVWPSCPSLPSARITNLSHHTWLCALSVSHGHISLFQVYLLS